MQPDARFDPLTPRLAAVLLGLCPLNFLGAAHGIDYAVELAENRIARRIDHPPLMVVHNRFGAGVKFANPGRHAHLVRPHHTAKPGNIRHQNGSQLPSLFWRLFGHSGKN